MPVPSIVQQQMIAQLKELRIKKLTDDADVRRKLRGIADTAAYHVEIYQRCLDEVLTRSAHSPEECTVVDYEGDYGLLSLLAKRLGFGKVIYLSASQEAIQVAQALAEQMGGGPDAVLQGGIDELRKWCDERGMRPHALVSMNEIGHIYVLDPFFAAVHSLSPSITMLFTTEATPYNKHAVKRLRRTMQHLEQGRRGKKGFLAQRRDFVQQHYPDLPDHQLDYWASYTRGLCNDDILRAVESQSPNLLQDPYNTCDPMTGRWCQRILPIDDYRHLLSPYGMRLEVLPGHCDEHVGWLRRWKNRRRNNTILKAPLHEPTTRRERRRMRKALKVAPFIYLIAEPK